MFLLMLSSPYSVYQVVRLVFFVFFILEYFFFQNDFTHTLEVL